MLPNHWIYRIILGLLMPLALLEVRAAQDPSKSFTPDPSNSGTQEWLEFKVDDYRFVVSPQSTYVEGYMGLPHAWVDHGETEVLSTFSTLDDDKKFDPTTFKESEEYEEYKKTKTEWAQEKGIELAGWIGKKTWKNKHGFKIFEFGFKFKFQGSLYEEKTYLATKGNRALYFKGMQKKIKGSPYFLNNQKSLESLQEIDE